MVNNKLSTITEDMSWILKVLLSSESDEQINYCDRLFKNFIKKWGLNYINGLDGFERSYDKIKFISKKRLKNRKHGTKKRHI